MSLNVLRHMMKFCNSAVLRLRILPILRLKYFCKNIHSCVRFANAEKKKAAPSREIELDEESEQSCSTGRYFFLN